MEVKPFIWPKGTKFIPRAVTNYAVVHHSKSGDVSANIINDWHLERDWKGIGYHYIIRYNGSIEAGRPREAIGAHTLGANSQSIGICLTGNFNQHKPTEAQTKALIKLVKWLKGFYPDIKLKGHNDFNATDCPGDKFPWEQINKMLKEDESVDSKWKDLEQCWYPELALEAVKLGLISGFDDGTLKPREKVDREQMWLVDLRQHKIMGQMHNIPKMVEDYMPSIVRIWSNGTVGSGSFIAPNLILTNSHVVNGQTKVTIDTENQKQIKGKVIKDAKGKAANGLDLALVQADAAHGKPLKLAKEIVHGEFCLVLGMPAGEWQSVSAGIVTRFGGDFLQVDALVNPGNSGGAILNSKGELLGVPTWKFVAQGFDNHNYDIIVGKVRDFLKGVL